MLIAICVGLKFLDSLMKAVGQGLVLHKALLNHFSMQRRCAMHPWPKSVPSPMQYSPVLCRVPGLRRAGGIKLHNVGPKRE